MSVTVTVKSFEDLNSKVKSDAGLTYHEMLKDGVDFAPMNYIAASLAYNLYEEGEVWDWDERRMVKGNTLQYAQNNALNGICYTLNDKVNKQRGIFYQKIEAAKRARRGATSQNGSNMYNNAKDAAVRAKYQLTNLEYLLDAFRQVHKVALGREYKYVQFVDKSEPEVSQHEVDLSAADAEMAALGVDMTDDVVTSPPSNDMIGPRTAQQATAEYLANSDADKPNISLNTNGIENVEEAEEDLANRQKINPVAGSAKSDPRMEDASSH